MSPDEVSLPLPDYSVRYGNCVVKIWPRADGQIAVSWREGGRMKKTTRASLESAQEYARKIARQIDSATGKRWITPAQNDRLDMLEALAGGASQVSELLHHLEQAVKTLGSYKLLPACADYYQTHGAGAVREASLYEALARVVEDYDDSPAATRKTMRVALADLKASLPDMPLIDITREMIAEHVQRPGLAKRTVWNRLSQVSTFFNRCRELELWPSQRAIPTASIKSPKKDDKAPEIFKPTEGKILLRRTVAECPQYLTYLLVAGWLMCRPSECLRLRWEAFDLEHAMLHLTADVVGKTHRERWVPIPAALLPFLRAERAAAVSDRVCLTTAREQLSIMARAAGMAWPKDVLRHSAITYRLQVLGSLEATAEEAGNSPGVIRKNYRRPIPPGWGGMWFSLLELLPGGGEEFTAEPQRPQRDAEEDEEK